MAVIESKTQRTPAALQRYIHNYASVKLISSVQENLTGVF
jgi:hypothetical protein